MQKISSVDALLTTQNVLSWSGCFGGGHTGWSQLQLASSVSPLCCLAGRRLVDWFGQRDWQNVWLTIGWLETVDSKIDLSLLIDWLHGWRLPSLLSWSAVGWLVWAKRLGNVWLTIGRWETVDSKIDLSLLIDWLHGWRLPSLLSWSAVGWLVWAKRLGNVWLTIGRWETVDSKIDLSLLIDWLHGWRLPSLLSWSAVGWWVWAKRLGNVWLTIGW